jgi:hypothetical protein
MRKLLLAISFLLVADVGHSRTLYPGQWAQVDPAEREWFRSQRAPNSKIPCCNEADGAYAEEEIRGDHYWVRFTWKFLMNGASHDMQTDWVEVPEDVVIKDPNRHGAPVVWWAWETGTTLETAKVRIRCYAPGAGI